MLLGKRQRAPIRRTTSMTDITVDLNGIEGVVKPQPSNQKGSHQKAVSDGGRRHTEGYMTIVSPRTHRKSSAEFLETAPFLRACGLCKRKLGHGRDIYMYRGDTAFCSLECRQQQMNQDERKEKCSMASMKKEAASSPTSGSEASSNGETVAAA